MQVKEFAKDLRTTIEGIAATGKKTIKIVRLSAYLREVEEANGDNSNFTSKDALNTDRELAHQTNLENFKAVIVAGQNAIKTMILINGGAAVAMLAFIGNFAGKLQNGPSFLAPSLLLFAIGSFLGGSVSGLTYLSRWLFANEKTIDWGLRLNILCIVAGAASFGCFLAGVINVYFALVT